MSKQIVLSEAAYYDLDSLFAFISNDKRSAAEKLRLRLYENIGRLADLPELVPAISEDDAPGVKRGYRRLVVYPYAVFYRVLPERIIIARVLHGKQNWLQMLFDFSDDN